MPLEAPNLDDRRFQDLVDDAKRMVQQRCPEWSDHNVHDPGVTLIETFAFMVDQLLYRVNRIPDKLHVSFLDLIGVRQHPPVAATAEVTFWLSAPQAEDVTVPASMEVATPRTELQDAIVFQTERALTISPRELIVVATQVKDGDFVVRPEALVDGELFPVFADTPQADDLLYFGLDDAAPGGVITIQMTCEVEGVGVDPRYPPLEWEAYDGTGWATCDVHTDTTGGLNKNGEVTLYLPLDHKASVIERVRGGWIRCKVVEPYTGYPTYTRSPRIKKASAFCIGGTVRAHHSETITDEIVGLSEGVAGQQFELAHRPVVAGEDIVVQVAGGANWDEWTEVDSFAGSSPNDKVFVIDRGAGILHFGPAAREPDGSMRQYGAVPPKGAPIRVPHYRTGGGHAGNVAPGALQNLRSSIPLVNRVENRNAAHGGVAAETVDEARIRGPLELRTRDRAITAEDYEVLAKRAMPGIARVKCAPAQTADDAGGVRVLIVPSTVKKPNGAREFADLVPPDSMLEHVAEHLDDRRAVGARLVIEPPFYQGITVVARLVARRRVAPDELRAQAIKALNDYFDPISGGPDGVGWPFGRPVQAGEVYGVLQQLVGTELVEDAKIFAADPVTGQRGDSAARIDLDPNALVFSFEHQVKVTGQ
jgi:predicted phage baseplate assembly protein